eukprot:48526-Eustigmatos_ZCMA.PRE.1
MAWWLEGWSCGKSTPQPRRRPPRWAGWGSVQGRGRMQRPLGYSSTNGCLRRAWAIVIGT